MALAVAVISAPGDASSPFSDGNLMSIFAKLTFSGSYSTGGEVWDPLPLFAGQVSQIIAVTVMGGAGNQFEYDLINKKLKGFSAANTELAAAAYNAAITGDVNIVAQIMAK